jgi:hypothetical protein
MTRPHSPLRNTRETSHLSRRAAIFALGAGTVALASGLPFRAIAQSPDAAARLVTRVVADVLGIINSGRSEGGARLEAPGSIIGRGRGGRSAWMRSIVWRQISAGRPPPVTPGQGRVVVIAHPDAGHVIGGEADEPGVARGLRGAGLARDLGRSGIARAAGAVGDTSDIM